MLHSIVAKITNQKEPDLPVKSLDRRCSVTLVKNEELSIFCGILSDAYQDSYVSPSENFLELPLKWLSAGFKEYEKKRKQIEAKRSAKLHFGCNGEITDPISPHDQLFEGMKDVLLSFGVVRDAKDLKKAYFAWSWLLKDGVYLPKSIQERLLPLKIRIDNSPMSKSDKKHIAVQAMAQVIADRFCKAKVVVDPKTGEPINGRCRMHGGLSTGAKTQEGKEKSREAARRGMFAYWAKKREFVP